MYDVRTFNVIISPMTVQEIYTKLQNPLNLQEHMLSVAKVAMFIYDHWNGDSLDKDLLLQTTLLHDVGNIVKFDMQKYPEYMGEEQSRIDYWMKVQKEIIDKYGADDHSVTEKMLSEFKIDPIVINNILSKSYSNTIGIVKSDNWILKILLYADLRVSPTGVISLRKRLDEVRERLEKYKDRTDLYEAAIEVENQIQQNISCNVSEITDKRIAQSDSPFLGLKIETK